ncbi:MAG: hypothetical protein ACRD07_09350 [Acidimicrobiales bacterium]
MNLYHRIDDGYRRLRGRPRPGWLTEVFAGDLDDAVTIIRRDQPDSTDSDRLLSALIQVGREEPDALTIALHALAPKLRTRLARTVTDDYRSDVLTDLAFVLLDGSLDGPRLAARVVNRAHSRAHKAVQRTRLHGTVNVTTVAPRGPEHFNRLQAHDEDIAATVARRVDLARFHVAVQTAIDRGDLSELAWAAYCDHRLRRVLDPDARVCSGHERITASRTARKLIPLIDTYLHAA